MANVYGAFWLCPIELACGPPQDIAHGYVNFNATVFSSRATYSCEQGFFLAGYDPVSVCSAGARWIPPPPTCEGERER